MLCRSSFVRFEDGTIHIRERWIRQIDRNMHTLVTLCGGIESRFAGLKHRFTELLI